MNLTLPKRVLARLDAKAKQHGEIRSGFIAHLAIQAYPVANGKTLVGQLTPLIGARFYVAHL